MLSMEFVFFLLLGAAAGGFVNGLAGFGTALFALGWWLQVMPPLQAVAVVLAMSVVSGIQGVIVVRRAIEWPRLLRFLLPALVGIPIGLQILERINADHLKIVVALFLLAYGGFFTLRGTLPSLSRPTLVVDSGVGFVSGILGAIAGLSGALPTMWLSMRDWPKEQTRAVLQPFNVVVLGLSALMLAWNGAYGRETLLTMAVALPATMIAAQAGLWTFKRLTDTQFRRLLVVMMFVSGLLLLAREGMAW
jgi:uncharacterized membrane protein YfcA